MNQEPATPQDPGDRGSLLRVQFAQAVSAMADVSLMWILLWWLFVHKPIEPTAEHIVPIMWPMAAGGLVYLVALPLAGALADRFERKRLAALGCLLRALVHLGVYLLMRKGRLAPESVLALAPYAHGVSMLGGALFDAASLSMVPRLAPGERLLRGMTYALVMPRAAFFIAGIACLLSVGLLDVDGSALCGAVFLGLSALGLVSIAAPTRAESPAAASSFWREILNPRLLWVAVLTGLLNFLIHPLYWVAPALNHPEYARPQSLPDNIEVCLVLGVLAGAFATPRLCRPDRLRPEELVSWSVVGLGLGLIGLGWSHNATMAYAASLGIGFSLMPILGLTGASALQITPDAQRGRAVALITMLFEAGGWLGSETLLPLLHEHGAGWILSAAAAPLVLLGLIGLLSRRLPAFMRLG